MKNQTEPKTSRTLNQDDIERINEAMLFEMPVYPTQAVVLFGSDIMSYYVAQKAAALIAQKWSFIPDIYICGGNGATEHFSLKSLVPDGKHPHEGEKEAEYMRRLLVEAGIPEERIKIDLHSTNTQQNIEHALDLGADKAQSVTLFCPPYLQRRAMMTCRRIAKNGSQALGAVACYPYEAGLTKDNWHNVHYIAFKMHEEAWKAGVLDHTPSEMFEDGDMRNYLERGFIVPVNFIAEAAYLRRVVIAPVAARSLKR